MDPQAYWRQKLITYSANRPNIFATQAIKYFPPHSIILEFGAGRGQDSAYFAQNGFPVTTPDLKVLH